MLEKICQFSEKLFLRYGIRSITMDDVAKELSISKKTIYQYVTDKDDLVKKTILMHIEEMDALNAKIIENESNAILQVIQLAEILVENHKEMNPSVLFDLKKYHPDTFNFYLQHKENTICVQVRKNLENGISQGYYRADMDLDAVISFYNVLIDTIVSSDIQYFNKLNFANKYYKLLDYHMHSICTENGWNFFKNNINNLNKQS